MNCQIFVNGVIYTLNQEQQVVSGIVVRNGRIVEIGDGNQLLRKYAQSGAEVIDFQGNMVLPGLTDSHMHLVAHGIKLLSLDLSECSSATEMKQRLLEKVEHTPSGEWIIGLGWNENNFADRKIFTKEELDQISSQHPILLTRVCNHAYLANSMALEIAEIQPHTPDPQGGKIVRGVNGEATGFLLENAGQLVVQKVPEPSYHELKKALQVAIQDCWSKGLVGAHTEDTRQCKGYSQTAQLFDEVLHTENYYFRVHELPYHEYLDDLKENPWTKESPFFAFGAVKLFADGAMGGRTALLSKPYSDDPSTNGVTYYSPEELQEIVSKIRSCHKPLAVHTIGDLALEYMLDAIEAHPVQHGLDRIIHAQVLRLDLLERMRKLRLIVDIQPRFVASDFPWVIERLGEERIRWSYAWKTLIHAGLICAGGSDAPIEPVDPLLGLHAAVTRMRTDEAEHEGYLPEQRLSPLEAVTLFTKGSAMTEQQYHLKGSIEPGKYADFTVYEKDLFKLEPQQWLTNRVRMTVVQGKVVYQGA